MGLIIDSFAGGGGASLGIERALNRWVDIAINHDLDSIRMHKTNHPNTKHFLEDVWHVNPKEATEGKPVDLMWLSPDCTHFSKAKGKTPKDNKIRGLAWVAVRWAKAVKPRVIILENVEEAKRIPHQKRKKECMTMIAVIWPNLKEMPKTCSECGYYNYELSPFDGWTHTCLLAHFKLSCDVREERDDRCLLIEINPDDICGGCDEKDKLCSECRRYWEG